MMLMFPNFLFQESIFGLVFKIHLLFIIRSVDDNVFKPFPTIKRFVIFENLAIKFRETTIMESYYIRHSTTAIEEDMTHEFKAHREMTKLDLSQVKYWRNLAGEYEIKVSRRRRPLSKTLCGMLNTGLKSTIYFGITDEGRIGGLMMSLYQKDHFMLSLRDLLSRYDPPVPEHRVSVQFVPVLEEFEPKTITTEIISYETSRILEHDIRSVRYCWCDNYTMAASKHGIIHR